MVSFYPLVFLFHQFSFTPFSVHPPNGGRTWTYGINIGCSFMNSHKPASSLSFSRARKPVNMFMNITIKMAFFRRRLALLGRVQQTMQAIFPAKSAGHRWLVVCTYLCWWWAMFWKALDRGIHLSNRHLQMFCNFALGYVTLLTKKTKNKEIVI